ncbi:hypothetical protein ccbrp13_31160 [Ktedonobacteria bacterium brp13]|nr:hypothetical protein ccbrp13_31160 [Ktedonobacteria bacterium brp13]
MPMSRNKMIEELKALFQQVSPDTASFDDQQLKIQTDLKEFLKTQKLNLQPSGNLRELFVGGMVTKLVFDVLLRAYAKHTRGLVIEAPIKLPDRLLEKAEDYPEGFASIMDIVRGSVGFENLKEIYNALGDLLKFLSSFGIVIHKIVDAELHDAIEYPILVKYKDRFLVPMPTGYRDVLLVFEIPHFKWERLDLNDLVFYHEKKGKLMLDLTRVDFRALGLVEEIVKLIPQNLAAIDVKSYYGLSEEDLLKVGLLSNHKTNLSFNSNGFKVELRLQIMALFEVGSEHHDTYKRYRTLEKNFRLNLKSMKDADLEELLSLIKLLQKYHDEAWERTKRS